MVGNDFLRSFVYYDEDYKQNNGVHERNGDNGKLDARRKKERARIALNTTSNMSIKLKYGSSSYYHRYCYCCFFIFVCLVRFCVLFIIWLLLSLLLLLCERMHMHTLLDSAMYRACTSCVCVHFLYFIWLTVENGHIRAMASLVSPAVILIVSFCNCLLCLFHIFIFASEKNQQQ